MQAFTPLPEAPLRLPKHPTLIRRQLDSRLKQCCPAGPLLAARLGTVRRRCGDPSCHCAKGGPLHVSHQLTLQEQGKTRTVYVPKDRLQEVRAWSDAHKRGENLPASSQRAVEPNVPGQQ